MWPPAQPERERRQPETGPGTGRGDSRLRPESGARHQPGGSRLPVLRIVSLEIKEDFTDISNSKRIIAHD